MESKVTVAMHSVSVFKILGTIQLDYFVLFDAYILVTIILVITVNSSCSEYGTEGFLL